MELKTLEEWTIERQYKSVPGVADDSGFGGGTMQYQALFDLAAKIAGVGLVHAAADRGGARAPITAMPGADSTPRAASSTTCAAWGF